MTLDWARDGAGWPHREASRFVEAGGLRWHVQQAGAGEPLLLLHGTGASTHSWRGLLPLLAGRHAVIAPDLPGHAFTATPTASAQRTLPGVARLVSALLGELGAQPAAVVGHSAGAAIALRMVLDGLIAPRAIVSLNGALQPWDGLPALLFAPIARLLSAGGVVPHLFTRRARDPAAVRRLVDGTGSTLDDEGVRHYARLTRDPDHVAGALAMMAHWDLRPLVRDLPRLRVPLALVVGSADRTVPPAQSRRLATQLPQAELIELPGLGHLAHEEAPGEVAQIVLDRSRGGVAAPAGAIIAPR
jgi:magnesium chelatase accessory protein